MKRTVTMDKLLNLCKSRGFVYAGSEIYGGLANAWDYGPLGAELKNNIKNAWWKKFVQECPYNHGVDAAILMNPEVWAASGHLVNFNDPLMDCKSCKARHRGDQIIEDYQAKKNLPVGTGGWSNEQMANFIEEHKIVCPVCGKSDFTPIRKFNMMFKTFQGVNEDTASTVYLRPETAQGMFVNFKNVQRTTRAKLPFGIAQVGKSFRNEITPGNFIFRTREFEQMELEFFCKPGTELEWFAYWKEQMRAFLLGLNLKPENLRTRDHEQEELSHYSNATTDFEYNFAFGWGELWGLASRTDFDLKAHSEKSGITLDYLDPETNEKYIPYCVEPSVGLNRLMLAFLTDAYEEEQLEKETRTVLKLHPALSPYKVAILPLQKNLGEKAREVYANLSKHFMVAYDETGSIGKRYRRQDEIGTPSCVTIDFQTLEDNTVTVRDRDTMQQIRININELKSYIEKQIEF